MYGTPSTEPHFSPTASSVYKGQALLGLFYGSVRGSGLFARVLVSVYPPSSFWHFFFSPSHTSSGPHLSTQGAATSVIERLQNDKFCTATNGVPERFEFGTLTEKLMAGGVDASEYIANLAPGRATSRRDKIVNSMRGLEAYEDELLEYMESSLKALPGITLHGHAKKRTPTLYFTFKGFQSSDIYKAMAKKPVTLPASNFHAF